MVLLRLLEGTNRDRFRPSVVSIGSDGVVADEIRRLDVEVCSLGLSRPVVAPAAVARTAAKLRRTRPDVVQTWMYHADLIGALASRAAQSPPVVWGLHATGFPPERRSLWMRSGLSIASRLSSRIPSRIICCSSSSMTFHERVGYDSSRMVVIPNGFEVPLDAIERASARRSLGIRDDAMVVARVGRHHPQKDHRSLFLAAEQLLNNGLDIELLLAGPGIERSNVALSHEWGSFPLERIHLLGRRSDIDKIYAAADVTVSSSSFGEALPLVLGESMARSTPVVTTDVGDSASLVGDPHRVVPPGSPRELATAIRRVLQMSPEERATLGERDRRRIETRFALREMVNRYEAVYEAVAAGL